MNTYSKSLGRTWKSGWGFGRNVAARLAGGPSYSTANGIAAGSKGGGGGQSWP